ncbi:MAG: cation-translocating P-type ATPase, partial [Candidatus Sericytochromatia bacterium]
EMKKLIPQKMKVIRDKVIKEIYSEDLVIGDLVILNEGHKIPADLRIIESEELLVNQSLLTGESEPVLVTKDISNESNILKANNMVFSGTYIVGGRGLGLVFATGNQTEFGKIAKTTQSVIKDIGHIQHEIAYVSKVISSIAIGMGLILFLFGYFKGINIWTNLIFTIGIIVANVPEGLLPTVTMSLAVGSRKMAKKNFLVKKLDVIENLGAITVIATDKTGTITENKMRVVKTFDNVSISTSAKPSKLISLILSLCNNTPEGSEDPTDKAIFEYTNHFYDSFSIRKKYLRIEEFPFDYKLKRMTTIDKLNSHYLVSTKGAFESIVKLCNKIQIHDKIEDLSEERKKQLIEANNNFSLDGLRNIAFAYKKITELLKNRTDFESDLVFAGIVSLIDPPRKEVKESIDKCKMAGIRVVMITGDNPLTSAYIAKETGIISDSSKVISGEELDSLSNERIKELLKENFVFARSTPDHKLKIITLLKEMGEIVAVTGDGVNDTPALKKADVGIAMGSGTDIAKEVSDVILLDDNFATIVNGIEEGRTCFDNIQKFITYILASNVPELIPYILFFVAGFPLALTVPQILAVDLGTDLIPALALGSENSEANVMQRKPKSKKEKLLTKNLFLKAYGFLGLIEAVILMSVFMGYLYSKGYHYGDILATNNIIYIQATSIALTSIILSQIGNGFAVRSNFDSIFKIGFFTNKFYLYGIVYELVLLILILYLPALKGIFGTTEFDLSFLIYLMIIPFVVLISEEVRKIIVRKFS